MPTHDREGMLPGIWGAYSTYCCRHSLIVNLPEDILVEYYPLWLEMRDCAWKESKESTDIAEYFKSGDCIAAGSVCVYVAE
jgi:hypothetical protein